MVYCFTGFSFQRRLIEFSFSGSLFALLLHPRCLALYTTFHGQWRPITRLFCLDSLRKDWFACQSQELPPLYPLFLSLWWFLFSLSSLPPPSSIPRLLPLSFFFSSCDLPHPSFPFSRFPSPEISLLAVFNLSFRHALLSSLFSLFCIDFSTVCSLPSAFVHAHLF